MNGFAPMTDPIRCPSCNSPDTVSYWARRTPSDSAGINSLVYIYQHHYPDARVCVDCEHVWWRQSSPVVDFRFLAKEISEP
jgi:Zn ribbon nucleic-acid-binding protein